MISCPSRMTDVDKYPNQHCKTCGMTFISKSDTEQYPIVDTEVCIGCVVKQIISEIFCHGRIVN